jgi:UDP-glucose 4-epimerase
MKILITGGAGYIGTELAYKLSGTQGVEEIIIYDNLSRQNHNLFIGVQKFNNKNIRFVNGDILDSRKLKKHITNVDVVYHLAAKVTTPFADQNPHLFEQVNHWGTAELAYAIENSSVKKLIYMSSVSVYGSSKEEVDVDSPVNPKTFYGISKLRGEEHIIRLFPKLHTYIVRCGNVYGYSKSMRFDAVINKFMFDANFAARITINGNGNQYRPFIHIEKVTSALVNIINSNLKSNRFDLVDKNITVNEVSQALKNIYPALETLYVNQHLYLRDLKVKPNTAMNQLISIPEKGLQKELEDFRAAFTY